MNADNFVELLSNSDVQDKFHQIFQSFVVTLAKEITQPLETKISELTATVKQVQRDIGAKDSQLANVVAENRKLREELSVTKIKLDQTEPHLRLVFTGLESSFSEIASASDSTPTLAEGLDVTVKKVQDFCKNMLGVEVSSADISVAHRLKSQYPSTKPPILVRFTSRIKRDEIFHARFKLKPINSSKQKQDRMYINDDLSDINRRLLKSAKEFVNKKELQGTWSVNCRVKVRCIDDSVHVINNSNDLSNVIATHSVSPFHDCS